MLKSKTSIIALVFYTIRSVISKGQLKSFVNFRNSQEAKPTEKIKGPAFKDFPFFKFHSNAHSISSAALFNHFFLVILFSFLCIQTNTIIIIFSFHFVEIYIHYTRFLSGIIGSRVLFLLVLRWRRKSIGDGGESAESWENATPAELPESLAHRSIENYPGGYSM